jgi:hypothetical protein
VPQFLDRINLERTKGRPGGGERADGNHEGGGGGNSGGNVFGVDSQYRDNTIQDDRRYQSECRSRTHLPEGALEDGCQQAEGTGAERRPDADFLPPLIHGE